MKRARNRLVSCEPMENRLMFVTINGTNAANAISVSIVGNEILYAVDGNSATVSDFLHNEIEINGLGGNDTITIGETGENTVTVHGGAGADTINLALGSNDMDNIDDFVTVNGDADIDTVTINDQNEPAAIGFTVAASNTFRRTNVPAMTLNVEDVVIRASASNTANLLIEAVPSPDVRFVGSPTGFNALIIDGNGTETVNYRPDDLTDGEGDITFSSADINFEDADVVDVRNVSSATFTTPNVTDVLTVSKTSEFEIDGTSTGIAMTALEVSDTDTVTIDMAASDSSGGNDQLTATGDNTFAGVLRVTAGNGNNTLRVNSGVWSMTTAGGLGGANLDIAIDVASVAFQGAQSIRRIDLSDDATASFTGTTGSNAVQHVAVLSGEGTLSTGNVNPLSITSSLAIAEGATLNKSGTGLLHVNGLQSHGANTTFVARGGNSHFNSDCGSVSSRTLDLFADNGDISLNATQHVRSLSTNFGDIHVGVNGNRVIVTNFAGVGGEGGSINLNDNDMIVDYANVAEANEVRAILRTGRNSGAWNGLGINSSSAATNPIHNTTLGSLEATEFKSVYGANATFDGQQLDNTMLLIKYTYYGDADFNGEVNFDDYSRIDAGFNGHRTGWLNGDFDDNGTINFDDYSLIDQAFNTQGSQLRQGSAPKNRA